MKQDTNQSKDILTANEMEDLGVLPMMFIGRYEVEQFPCMALDDSNEYNKKRQDMCMQKSYASHRLETKIGVCWIPLCKLHWSNMMRAEYG